MVAYMAVARKVTLLPTKSLAWKELGGASNLIGWRFRACYEEMSRYIESWKRFGSNVSFEELYSREKALFGMFTAGVSCIESACYALYALASHPNVFAFPFGEKEQRICSPARLKKRLINYPDTEALVASLDLLISSPEWALWVDFRNRMSHRSNLPTIILGAVGTEPPPTKALQFGSTKSTPAFEDDIPNLESLFDWLAQSLCRLLAEGRAFVNHPKAAL
jgi:hypothetical protein